MRVVRWFPPLYADRAEGGRELAAALARERAIVVGIARGGVATAAEVAAALDVPLTAVDVEPVNAGGLRLGAVTANGPPFLREDVRVPRAAASQSYVEYQGQAMQSEDHKIAMERLRQKYAKKLSAG